MLTVLALLGGLALLAYFVSRKKKSGGGSPGSDGDNGPINPL